MHRECWNSDVFDSPGRFGRIGRLAGTGTAAVLGRGGRFKASAPEPSQGRGGRPDGGLEDSVEPGVSTGTCDMSMSGRMPDAASS
jgi:hypothetical protein